ncbi:hypothetical protein STVA_26200 [Allostella vacuolata]|nr:hypothetical protein STVA_26200 [Stella vacuolata]
MNRQMLYDGSTGARCPVSVPTRRSTIGIFRHRSDNSGGTLVGAPGQDAHLLIFQLREQPAHEYWRGGRPLDMPAAAAGSLGIRDLRRETAAVLANPVDSLHVHLPRAALDDLAEDAGAPPIDELGAEQVWQPGDATMQRLHPILVDVLDKPGRASKPFVDHLVLAVATHIAATYGGMRAGSIRRGGLAPWQVKRAREMLAANLAKEVSLLEVAEACGLSPSYFSRAFRKATGETPHAWLQSCRIERARDLLRDPDQPLAEIALRCGFADQSHFTRMFRRATGMGPGAWRRLRPRPISQ